MCTHTDRLSIGCVHIELLDERAGTVDGRASASVVAHFVPVDASSLSAAELFPAAAELSTGDETFLVRISRNYYIRPHAFMSLYNCLYPLNGYRYHI